MLRPIRSTQRDMKALGFRVDGTSTGVKEVSTVQTIADVGVKEVTTVTTVADVASSLNSTYFTFKARNTGGATETGYYVWYNIGGAGVDPAVASHTAIPVAEAADATADEIALATRAAITSVAGGRVVVTGATDEVIITSLFMGDATNAADGAAATGFTIATSTEGVASNLLNKYFVINTALDAISYYVWINVNSEGTDPLVAGKTAVPIAVALSASADTIATAIQVALDALAGFVATVLTDTVTVTNADDGATTDLVDTGSTGFTLAVTTAGVTSSISIIEGFNDAVLTEGSADAGDYLFTFSNGFRRTPLIMASPLTANVTCQVFSVSTTAVRIKCFDYAGSVAKDSDFHMLVVGSYAADQDGHL